MDYLGGVGFCRKNFRVLKLLRETLKALVCSLCHERDRQHQKADEQCAEHEEHRIELGKLTYLHGLSHRESARPAARAHGVLAQHRRG